MFPVAQTIKENSVKRFFSLFPAAFLSLHRQH
jgi:hypothetical protein